MSREIEASGRISWAKRLMLFGFGALVIGASVFGSQSIWRENGLRSLQAINEQRVQLFANALRSEINRQDHLPLFLSVDRDVQNLLMQPPDAGSSEALNRKLSRLSLEADTSALYVLDPSGTVRASSDFERPGSLLGRKLDDQSSFKRALAKGRSANLGLDPDARKVRYYIAEAVSAQQPLGVAMVRIEFDQIEDNWGVAGERVFVTDKDGLVFLSTDPVYKSRLLPQPDGSGTAPQALQGRDQKLPISFEVVEQLSNGSIIKMSDASDGDLFLYQVMALPRYGWTIHRLSGLEPIDADVRDGGLIGGALSAMLIVLLLYVFQRHRAYVYEKESGNRLKAEVERRTRELRDTNLSLEAEIEERRRAESKLRTTQNELVQAGKLAALGQMSAAIAHEINQPLAAIRTFIASTLIFAERGDSSKVSGNLQIINNLATRMANVTSHLKIFARKSDPTRPEPVRVTQAVEGALFLVDSQIRASGARVEKQFETPDLQITGFQVQLEQVLVNLLSNALDAVSDRKKPWIGVRVWAAGERAYISVSDNGPGIAEDLISQIFDPFVTTKPVSKGLGLGLSISYGIVQDFQGNIRAANRVEGGAVLTIDLPIREVRSIVPVSLHA